MNPDTNSPPPEDDAVLEKHLRALACPALPPEWRDPILKKAAPPAWPWMPTPLRWGLAACWTAIGILQVTTPPAPAPSPEGIAAHLPVTPPEDFEKQMLAQQGAHTLEPENQEP